MKTDVLTFEEYLCLLAIRDLEKDGVVIAIDEQIDQHMKELLLRIGINTGCTLH